MKQNKLIGIILMFTGVVWIIGGYAGFTVNDVCPCATNQSPCYCGSHENPVAPVIIYLGISISASGVILFIITTFKKS